METKIARTDTPEATGEAIKRAVRLLSEGEVVALPTETVYGLAGDATNVDAISKIFEAKERPLFDPLIVHVVSKGALGDVAVIPEAVSGVVRALAENFWPGPLTLVLPKREVIPDMVTAGTGTVAVRCSGHPVMKKVIRAFGRPLAAPSANRFGRISPTSHGAVLSELGGRIPMVVDGGACACGLESTIVAVAAGEKKPLIRVLRNGPVTPEDLKRYGKVEQAAQKVEGSGDGMEAPGQSASHYAPVTPLRLLERPEHFRPETGKRYALLSYRGQEKDGYVGLTAFAKVGVLSPGSGKLPEAGVRFFYLLRELDESGVDEIVAEPVPLRGLGHAIMDRLKRAALR
ncbi:MAG: L-threonylcarbamoyladenylate synthase [Verrucomicrobiota bacterium]